MNNIAIQSQRRGRGGGILFPGVFAAAEALTPAGPLTRSTAGRDAFQCALIKSCSGFARKCDFVLVSAQALDVNQNTWDSHV